MENLNSAIAINEMKIVGAVTSIDIIDDVSKVDGTPIKRGTVTVKAGDAELVLNTYQAETYRNGNENRTYKMLNEIVVGGVFGFVCQLDDNKFVPPGSEELITSYRVRLVFINRVDAQEAHEARFTYGGVVLKPLQEVLDKEGNLLTYNIILGQKRMMAGNKPNPDAGFNTFRFNVDPRNTAAISAIQQNYSTGTTVKVSGVVNTVVREQEVVEEAMFGENKVQTFYNRFDYYNIVTGLAVKENEIYSESDIETLAAGTRASDEKRKLDSKNKQPATKSNVATTKKSDPLGDMFG